MKKLDEILLTIALTKNKIVRTLLRMRLNKIIKNELQERH